MKYSSSTLRQLWSVIEETQASILLEFSDAELTEQLLRQLEEKRLDWGERKTIKTYIRSRLPLIRDIAASRQMSSIGKTQESETINQIALVKYQH